MSLVLVVQKDTLEDDKIKSILKIISISPEDFLTELQEGHPIEYQLIAFSNSFPIPDKLFSSVSKYKTNYGKDWYEFDHLALGRIISAFLENDVSTINVKAISSIMRFSFTMFPVVTKEIITKEIQIDEEDKKDEIVEIIETLSELPRKEKKKESSKKSSKK